MPISLLRGGVPKARWVPIVRINGQPTQIPIRGGAMLSRTASDLCLESVELLSLSNHGLQDPVSNQRVNQFRSIVVGAVPSF